MPSETDACEALEGPLTTTTRSQPNRTSARWNQFQVNQDRFGVTTSFDEDLYTTKLDKSRSKFSQADADRIANEIEGQVSGNAHVAEERGAELDQEACFELLSATFLWPLVQLSCQMRETTEQCLL